MAAIICRFPSNHSSSIAEVGGKGYNLMQMSRYMPVPPGLILTTEFFTPWWNEIKQTDEWQAFLNVSERLMNAVSANLKAHAMFLQFNDQQNDAIAEALEAFPSDPLFAVRSSSPEEDLEGSSFAGVYETVLGVSRKNIQAAVRTCFASSLDYRIVQYKRQNGYNIHDPKIAVVLQRQIASKQSGVAFSLNPLNNDYDEAVINANYGLGESVVSGQITPDTFVVDKISNGIIYKNAGKKQAAVFLEAGGGTRTEPRQDDGKLCISDQQAIEICKLATAVERRNGKPMDIEWAFDTNDKLYLLQARPITAFQPLPPDLVTMPGRERRLYLDVTRSVQGLEQPLSEMGASIIKLIFSRVSINLFERDITDHVATTVPYITAGRAYANLSNMLNFTTPEKLATSLQAMDALASRALLNLNWNNYRRANKSMKLLPLAAIRRVPWVPLRMLKARTQPEEFRAEADHEIDIFRQQLHFVGRTKTTLRQFANKCIDTTLHLVFSRLGPMLVSGVRAKDRIGELAGKDLAQIVEALTKALPGNVTVAMGLGLYTISRMVPPNSAPEEIARRIRAGDPPELREAWREFLDQYGHRAPQEFDIATPRFRDDDSFLIKQLASLSQLKESDKNPEETWKQAGEARAEAHRKLEIVFTQRNRMSAIRFHTAYRILTSFLGMRESPKFCLMLALDAVRVRIIEASHTLVARGLLDDTKQIWELSFEQVCAALEGTPIDLRTAIIANRARRARLKLATMPKIFDSRGRIIRPPVMSIKDNEIAGVAISAGVVRGIARVLHSPDEQALHAGDILVARATDPGWTPLFATASAVVLEVGGMLQHGALVAREYGLPCVAGIENVTTVIKDGCTIEVDGTNGIVRLLS